MLRERKKPRGCHDGMEGNNIRTGVTLEIYAWKENLYHLVIHKGREEEEEENVGD